MTLLTSVWPVSCRWVLYSNRPVACDGKHFVESATVPNILRVETALCQLFIKRSSLYNWPLCQAFIYLLKQCTVFTGHCSMHPSIELVYWFGHCTKAIYQSNERVFQLWIEEAIKVFCFLYNQEGQRLLIVKFYVNYCCIMMQHLRIFLVVCDIVNISELSFWKDIW